MSRAMLSAMMIGVFTMTAAVPDEGQAAQGAIAYSPGRAQVVFATHDYGYTGPDRIPAGITTVEIVNQGQDLHHGQIVKLLAGKTAEEFVSAMKSNPAHWPSWVSFVGGPNGIVPGDRTTATMRLDARPLSVAMSDSR